MLYGVKNHPERLHGADHRTREHRAAERTHTAEDRRHQPGEAHHRAGGEGDAAIEQRDRCARKAGERGRDQARPDQRAPRIKPHQLRRLRIIRDGAPGPAEAAFLHHQQEEGDHHEVHRDHAERAGRDHHLKAAAAGECHAALPHRLQPGVARALGEAQTLLHRDHHPHARDENGLPAANGERVQHALAHHETPERHGAEREGHRDWLGRKARAREKGGQQQDREARAHPAHRREFAESEVDAADEPVDQRGCQCEQRQQRQPRQAAEHILQAGRKFAGRQFEQPRAAPRRTGIGHHRELRFEPAIPEEPELCFAEAHAINGNRHEIALRGGITRAAEAAGEQALWRILAAGAEGDVHRAR